MRILRMKGRINLINILKVFVALAVLLIITGGAIGFVNIFLTNQERKDIAAINISIANEELSTKTKDLIQDFAKKYPRTKNIIVCDSNGNVLFSANSQLINGKTSFIPEQVDRYPGIFRLKDGSVWFITDMKNAFRMKLKPDLGIIRPIQSGDLRISSEFTFRGQWIDDRKDKGGESFLGQKQYIKNHIDVKDKLYLNKFNINSNDKDFNIYFISNGFRENSLMTILFIINAAFRLVFIILWILIAIWVFLDSRERNLHYVFWGLLTIATGFAGLLIYLIFKSFMYFCHMCKCRVDKDSNYCHECGSTLKLKCGSCGQRIGLGYEYCPNCGEKQVRAD
jgi:hypothetical protein